MVCVGSSESDATHNLLEYVDGISHMIIVFKKGGVLFEQAVQQVYELDEEC